MKKFMPQRGKETFSLKSEKQSEAEEEMDFNDVFGGPPKRFSMQEIGARFSFESSEDEVKALSPWSGLKEKRVFGEEVRARRRQPGNDDFFNDIFQSRDTSFGSNPGSRVMSPKLHPLSSSPPPPLSLAGKVSKELPTFGSPSPSPLSRFSSDDKSMLNHFHFSIYKWPGRGVPMLSDLESNFTKLHPPEPVRTHDVDKHNSTVLKEEEHVPVKKKTQLKKPILNEPAPDHQEIKDKKPETPRADDPKVVESDKKTSAVKEFVQIFEQESGDVAPKHEKFEHVSFKVIEDLNNHQPSQPSTNPNTTASSDTKISEENADDHFDDNFMVEEIFETEENDETKAIDAKIRQWSVGKKGNIRSLLSTLQYVLWEDSGWKAVALVDLIEANAVKRAYQKALLRLHPDKLQQKAASFNHKYTAQKVFDILQEAWDHFNTSSLIV